MSRLLLLGILILGCDPTGSDPYFGPASLAVVAAPGDLIMVIHGGDRIVAVDSDSVCQHFQATGTIETFFVSSAWLPDYVFSWLPSRRYPSVLFLGSGGVLTQVGGRLC